MARANLNEALDNVEITYRDIAEIANDMLSESFIPINRLISEINDNINSLSIESVRDYMLRCQLRAYEISEMKDKSAVKALLAEALQKEKLAKSFNAADGSAAVKDKIALLEASEETVVEALYNLTASLLKTKLDSLYRMVDTLKSILMSRMQETKFMNIGTTNDIPRTTGQIYNDQFKENINEY